MQIHHSLGPELDSVEQSDAEANCRLVQKVNSTTSIYRLDRRYLSVIEKIICFFSLYKKKN